MVNVLFEVCDNFGVRVALHDVPRECGGAVGYVESFPSKEREPSAVILILSNHLVSDSEADGQTNIIINKWSKDS